MIGAGCSALTCAEGRNHALAAVRRFFCSQVAIAWLLAQAPSSSSAPVSHHQTLSNRQKFHRGCARVGGVFDGRGLASALSYGAHGVWVIKSSIAYRRLSQNAGAVDVWFLCKVGTRFIASHESHGSPAHKEAVVNGKSEDTVRTIIYSGRPMRVLKNPVNA